MHRLTGRFTRFSAAAVLAAGGIVIGVLPPPPRVIELGTFPPGESIASVTTLRGTFHVHSRHSDGSGTVDEIAAAAAAAGLDFVILTDHGDATIHRPPSYRQGVLVIQGVEISTDAGHYVALGLPAAPYPLGGDARGVVEDVRRLQGFGVIAHPASPRTTLAWSDWSVKVDGIEWLNGDSQWRDDSPAALLRAAAAFWFRPPESLASLLDRPDPALALWDMLAAERPTVGLGASDAHARLALDGDDEYDGAMGLRFPGYEAMFRAFGIRVELDRPLTRDADDDGAAVIEQLRAGRTFTAIDALASPVRFDYTASTSDGGLLRMGEQAPLGQRLTLRVAVAAPPDAMIRLLGNGRTVARAPGSMLLYPVPPGDGPAAYRVEVALPEAPGRPAMPWIVSNPIYAGVPAQAPDVTQLRGVSMPLSGGPWHVERRSDATATVMEDASGFRLAFTLGPDMETYVAAGRILEPGTLADATAILLDAEATLPMRVSLQLRYADAGLGELRWRRSFYGDPQRRTLRLPIDDFAPVAPNSVDGPDLNAPGSLLVVVDTVNTRPGTRGELAIDGLRVELTPGSPR